MEITINLPPKNPDIYKFQARYAIVGLCSNKIHAIFDDIVLAKDVCLNYFTDCEVRKVVE